MLDPTYDERSFLLWLHESGGSLTLYGDVGLLGIARLIPDYVTQEIASHAAHFSFTEMGRRLAEQLKQG